MDELLVGILPRIKQRQQDLTAQRDDMHPRRHRQPEYVDHGLTRTNRDRTRLREAFVVTKLDRLAPYVPNARDILYELTEQNCNSASAARSASPLTGVTLEHHVGGVAIHRCIARPRSIGRWRRG